MTTGVYLIHFETPYHHARHYIGYSPNIEERIKKHRAGNGARLMEVVNEAKIAWRVAFIWPNADRAFERKLKDRHGAGKLCPICKGKPQMSLWELFDHTGYEVHNLINLDWDSIAPIPFN